MTDRPQNTDNGRGPEPLRILFICHGNICRSPMAEFVMKDLAEKAGLSELFEIESAATSREEIWRDGRTGKDVGSGTFPV